MDVKCEVFVTQRCSFTLCQYLRDPAPWTSRQQPDPVRLALLLCGHLFHGGLRRRHPKDLALAAAGGDHDLRGADRASHPGEEMWWVEPSGLNTPLCQRDGLRSEFLKCGTSLICWFRGALKARTHRPCLIFYFSILLSEPPTASGLRFTRRSEASDKHWDASSARKIRKNLTNNSKIHTWDDSPSCKRQFSIPLFSVFSIKTNNSYIFHARTTMWWLTASYEH